MIVYCVICIYLLFIYDEASTKTLRVKNKFKILVAHSRTVLVMYPRHNFMMTRNGSPLVVSHKISLSVH